MEAIRSVWALEKKMEKAKLRVATLFQKADEVRKRANGLAYEAKTLAGWVEGMQEEASADRGAA